MTTFADPLTLRTGPQWRNRLALAPLTNVQSNPDGTLTDDEINWLTARTGFGLVVTAAAFVAPAGRAWVGQLGVDDDAQLPGLARLADGIRADGAVSAVQLHHGGYRAEASLTGQVEAPFDVPESGARALTTGQVHRIIDDFAAAARRVERAGFDGVQLHGAHGYLLCEFLDPRNTRTDGYGGDLAGRSRIIFETIEAVRSATSAGFQVGIRLSVERFGIVLPEMVELARTLLAQGRLDHLEASVWDYTKRPEGAGPQAPTLLAHFVDLPRHGTALGFAGRIRSSADAAAVIGAGADFATIGRSAIADHRFAERALAEPDYPGPSFPVTRQQLSEQYLTPKFVAYFAKGWPDYVSD